MEDVGIFIGIQLRTTLNGLSGLRHEMAGSWRRSGSYGSGLKHGTSGTSGGGEGLINRSTSRYQRAGLFLYQKRSKLRLAFIITVPLFVSKTDSWSGLCNTPHEYLPTFFQPMPKHTAHHHQSAHQGVCKSVPKMLAPPLFLLPQACTI